MHTMQWEGVEASDLEWEDVLKYKVVLVTGHDGADHDALGAMVLTYRLCCAHGRTPQLIWPGSRSREVEALKTYWERKSRVRMRSKVTADDPLRLPLVDDVDVDVDDVHSLPYDDRVLLIIVDTSRRARVPHVHHVLQHHCSVCVWAIDHHERHTDDVSSTATSSSSSPSVKQLRRFWGSCVSVLCYEWHHFIVNTRQQRQPVRITSADALCAAVGIHSDTGSLTHNGTTAHDIRALLMLSTGSLVTSQLSLWLSREHSRSLSVDQTRVKQQLLSSAESFAVNGLRVWVTHCAHESPVYPVADVVDHLMRSHSELCGEGGDDCSGGVDVVFSVMSFGGSEVLCVGRSRHPQVVDVAHVCSLLGPKGGGHASAAAVTLKGTTVGETRDVLIAHLRSLCGDKRSYSVTQLMSSPPITLPHTALISDAVNLFRRSNLKKIPIVRLCGAEEDNCDMDETEDERGAEEVTVVGIADRMECERALQHNCGHMSISIVMTVDFVCVDESCAVATVYGVVMHKHQRCVPVVRRTSHTSQQQRSGVLLGVITRADIVHLITHDRDWSFESDDVSREFKQQQQRTQHLIHDRFGHLPVDVKDFLRAAGALADDMGLCVYVVGGFVRDLLLQKDNDDIDLVVIGDGIAYAERLNARVGKRLQVKGAVFRTAVVHLRNGWKVDVCSSRIEYYPSAGALPVVEHEQPLVLLRLDLWRRDVTFNTMALALHRRQWLRLRDPLNGALALRQRVVRVIHSLSFVEDPTRMFRCVRFSQRYGFSLSAQTRHLMRSAIALKAGDWAQPQEGSGDVDRVHPSVLLSRITGSRLFHELEKIFNEEEVVNMLTSLHEEGLLGALHSDLGRTYDEQLMRNTRSALKWYRSVKADQEIREWMVWMLSLCHGLSSEALEQLLGPPHCASLRTGMPMSPSELSDVHHMSHRRWRSLLRCESDAISARDRIVHYGGGQESPMAVEGVLAMIAVAMGTKDCAHHVQFLHDYVVHYRGLRGRVAWGPRGSLPHVRGRLLGVLKDHVLRAALLDGLVSAGGPSQASHVARVARGLRVDEAFIEGVVGRTHVRRVLLQLVLLISEGDMWDDEDAQRLFVRQQRH